MFNATFTGGENFTASFATPESVAADFKDTTIKTEVDPYPGPYAVIPSTEEQVIPINGKTATRDIVVRAVPPGFGEIIWLDGNVILVR